MAISFKKISIVYKYLISYVIILSIPLLILGYVLYNNSVIELQKEVENIEILKATNMKDFMDKQINELEKVAIKVIFDRYMAPHIVKKNDYYTKLTCENLSKYKYNSVLIDEIFLYYRGDSTIISSGGKMSLATLCQRFFNSDNEAHIRLYENLNNNDIHMIMGTEESIDYSESKERYIMYIYPALSHDDNSSAVLMFSIRESTLINYLKNIIVDKNIHVYIYNNISSNSKCIIFSNEDRVFTLEEAVHIFRNAIESSVCYISLDNKEFSIVKATSDLNNLQFISVTPKTTLFKIVHNSRNYIIKVVLLVIVLGIFIAIYLSIFNYTPIKKLSKKTNEGLFQTEQKAYKNEIEEIESRILHTIEKNKNLTQQINYHQVLFKNQVLIMLLRGEINGAKNANDILDFYNISLKEGYTRVIVLSFESFQRQKVTYSDITFWLKVALRDKIINGKYYFVELTNNEMSVIVNMKNDNPNKEFFYRLSEDIISIFSSQLNIKIAIGIGKSYEKIKNIRDSYHEALTVLDYQMMKGNEEPILFEDIIASKNAMYWYPIDEIMNASQCLKQGNISSFNDALNNILVNIISRKLSMGFTKSICFGIINTIINLVNEINTDKFTREIEELTQFKALDDFRIRLEDIAYKICMHVNDTKVSNNEKLKKELMNYLNEEFKNSDISLETVAEKFDISPGYLSRFFKEQIGLKFIDYLKTQRICEAKKLLASTEMLVKDIVNEVGYIDVSNFTRTFRLIEGVTPGEYRKIHFHS